MSALSPSSAEFDFLALEELLVSRLGEAVPALREVRGDSTLGDIKGSQLSLPAALVLWTGAQVLDDTNPEASLVEQSWAVVLVVKHAGDKTGQRARNTAGALIPQVIRAVQSWQPSPEFAPMRWTEEVQPEAVAGGFLYVPLMFRTAFAMPAIAEG